MASLHTSQPRQPGIRELVDQKAPLKLKDIWAFQVRVQLGSNVRGLALFNLAIEDRCRRGRRLPGPGSRAGRVRGWDPRSSRVGRFHPRAGGMGSAPVPVRDASVPISGGPAPITRVRVISMHARMEIRRRPVPITDARVISMRSCMEIRDTPTPITDAPVLITPA